MVGTGRPGVYCPIGQDVLRAKALSGYCIHNACPFTP